MPTGLSFSLDPPGPTNQQTQPASDVQAARSLVLSALSRGHKCQLSFEPAFLLYGTLGWQLLVTILTSVHIAAWFSEQPAHVSMFDLECQAQERLAQLSPGAKMEKGLVVPALGSGTWTGQAPPRGHQDAKVLQYAGHTNVR